MKFVDTDMFAKILLSISWFFIYKSKAFTIWLFCSIVRRLSTLFKVMIFNPFSLKFKTLVKNNELFQYIHSIFDIKRKNTTIPIDSRLVEQFFFTVSPNSPCQRTPRESWLYKIRIISQNMDGEKINDIQNFIISLPYYLSLCKETLKMYKKLCLP